MTVSSFNSGASIQNYAKSYEDQLLLDEESKGALDKAGAESAAMMGKAGQSPLRVGNNGKPSGKDDDLAKEKKGISGDIKKDSIKSTEQKGSLNKSEAVKTEESKETVKTDAIKQTINTDAISRMVVSKEAMLQALKAPALMENVTLSQKEAEAAYDTAVKLTSALTDVMSNGTDLASLSAADLLAAFMKIQLEDPAKKTDTLNELNDLMKNLRQLGHKNEIASLNKQEVEQEEAIKKANSASKYANAMGPFKIIATVIVAVAIIVLSVCTLGTAAIVALAIVIAVCLAASFGASATEASKNLAAAEQAAKAAEAQMDALDFERMKEMFQEMVGENQELLQAIMESFNQFCSLLKTLVDRQGSNVKVLSDATMR